MNNLTERRLVTRYQSLLYLPDSSTPFFGFECNDGWADLLEGTFRVMRLHAEKKPQEVKVVQVKEMFGQLRIYQRGGDDMVDLALDITELVSSCVCEVCGEIGEIKERHGWLQARCASHWMQKDLEVIESRSSDECYIVCYAGALNRILWFFNGSSARWVQQKSVALGGMRPFEAMATSDGCRSVYTLLKRLEYGAGV